MPQQGELFAPPPPVAGLRLVPEAVSEADEARIAALIDAAPLAPFQFGQWQGKRLTVHYGSAYDYQRARPTEAPPLPEWLADLRARLAPLMGRDPEAFIQGLLIRYDPGAGIGWHRDRPQYGEVLGLSLSAPAMLRRSLYLLSGEVRREWEHSIAPMDVTRRSVTLRTMVEKSGGM